MDTSLLLRIVMTAVLLALTFLILYFIKKYLVKKVAYEGRETQHFNTFIGIIFNVAQYVVVLLMIVIILKVNGLDVKSMITGLGIVATIIGLALQDTLKDVISGMSIYTNNFYKVGDVVNYNGTICEVKYFSARVTKLRNVFTDSSYTIYNSQIRSMEKVKEQKVIALSFPFDVDTEKLTEAMDRIGDRLNKEDDLFHDAGHSGISGIDANGLSYYVYYKTDRRDFFHLERSTKIIYEELNKIQTYPYTVHDISMQNQKLKKSLETVCKDAVIE